jgi:hypothetical protein
MDTFQGRAHVPGTDSEWIIILEMDWKLKTIDLHTEGQPGHVSNWPGLAVQTFGDYEIAFKTKGIPPLLTHWWHFVRPSPEELWGIILGLPDKDGKWTYCPVDLKKVSAK